MVSIQNKIRTRYQFAQFEAMNDQDRETCQYKSAKTKRGRREGDGKKNVTTIYDKRHVAILAQAVVGSRV